MRTLTSDILYRAADTVEARGWVSGSTKTHDPWGTEDASHPVCLEGAIFIAIHGDTQMKMSDRDHAGLVKHPAYQAMVSYLDLRNTKLLFYWNDGGDRTQDEVVNALRSAAVIAHANEEELAGAHA